MSQPSTIDKTFDTSLIDIQRSFSSTETNTSGSSGKENIKPAATADDAADLTPRLSQTESRSQEASTNELYDQWASTYDTDGNVLQACDDFYFPALLAQLVDVLSCRNAGKDGEALRLLDLGCGTGRNTLKLLNVLWNCNVDIVGWDASHAMLQLATAKCASAQEQRAKTVGLEFEQMDFFNVAERHTNSFHGIISTLVLEHFPASTFFGPVSQLLKPGGFAVVTNMHPEMGRLSPGAGFKTSSGERIRGVTYVHTVEETVDAAKAAGLEVVGDVVEKEIRQEDVARTMGLSDEARRKVEERARKWEGVKVWFGMVLRKKCRSRRDDML